MFDIDNFVDMAKSGNLNLNESIDVGIVQEDPENDVMLMESYIIDNYSKDEITSLLESTEIRNMVEVGLLNEKSIVKLDKYARISRAESQAALAIAKENNDRDFKKLMTVYKLKKLLLAKIHKKYGTQAKKRAREVIKNSKLKVKKK